MNLKRSFKKLGMKISKHSPTILVIGGCVTFVGTVVAAIIETEKHANDIVLDHEDSIADVKDLDQAYRTKEVENDFTEAELTKIYRNNMVCVYRDTAIHVIKAYWPVAALGTVSLACFLTGHNILKKRYLGAVAAFNGLSEVFAAYRQRVIEDQGLDKDREYRFGVKKDKIDLIDPETGKKKKTEVLTSEFGVVQSPYSVIFDEASREWEKNMEYNIKFLEGLNTEFNMQLAANGYVFLNDIYRRLDLPETPAGQLVGWLDNGDGDGYIDFGLFQAWNKQAIVNDGDRRADQLILDFNVDGIIYDKI